MARSHGLWTQFGWDMMLSATMNLKSLHLSAGALCEIWARWQLHCSVHVCGHSNPEYCTQIWDSFLLPSHKIHPSKLNRSRFSCKYKGPSLGPATLCSVVYTMCRGSQHGPHTSKCWTSLTEFACVNMDTEIVGCFCPYTWHVEYAVTLYCRSLTSVNDINKWISAECKAWSRIYIVSYTVHVLVSSQ